ncbi:MAG: electron transport complex subunit RsxC [Candidatus Omnitrophica bacterium]|nr:electron transport complex subunit RsxC [Candidatus Omnitrophota bacterium]
MKGFSGGIHPPCYKDSSLINPIKQVKPPSSVTIPFVQHIGAPAKPLIKIGDSVKVGTKIGEASGFISSPVHASISGTVKKIDFFPHPVLGRAQAAYIESDGRDERDVSIKSRANPEALLPAEIIDMVKEAGVVGLGGAAFPTHVKLSPPPSKKIDTIIINGAECEPYLTCDHMLMLYNPVDIIKGTLLIMKAVGAQTCFIGIEKNKMDAYELFLSKIRGMNIGNIHPVLLDVKYPQGAEKQLIKSIVGREVPLRGLPMDVGVIVQNVGTTVAVYEAVYFNKPLFERIVTVSGRFIKSSQNVRVRVGMSFRDVIQEIGGLLDSPLRVIMGGPLMGIAQERLEIPIVKATSGILIMSPAECRFPRTRPCIRCGRCVDVCPMGLVPNIITLAGESERYTQADEWGVHDCIECGACAYVCPAKRPMVQSVKMIKNELLRQEKLQQKEKNLT